MFQIIGHRGNHCIATPHAGPREADNVTPFSMKPRHTWKASQKDMGSIQYHCNK